MTSDPPPDPGRHDADDSPEVSRAQMIEDGLLIDLTDWARPVGIPIPVACTDLVWLTWIAPPPGTREVGQSERGRGHAILRRLAHVIRRHADTPLTRMPFKVLLLASPQVERLAELVAHGHLGDPPQRDPVITLQLPDEPQRW
ncbi:DUF6573 family protein [Phycisphaerales bacterium AB-hyl4]|uniref:DUF6573 family protein n=1 Tax=Natronomicrosphaera hydrolytica TaxID=3242702 RepID=A0ABV4UAN0_9BACT